MLKPYPTMGWYLEIRFGEIIRVRLGHEGGALMMGLVALEEKDLSLSLSLHFSKYTGKAM